MPALNGLDYVLIVVLLYFILTGLTRGFVRQVVDLAAWGVAIYLAFTYGAEVARVLVRLFALDAHFSRALGPIWGNFEVGRTAVNVLGFIVVFIAVRLAGALTAEILDLVTRLPVLHSINQLGGAGLGLVKGIVAIFLVATIIKALPGGAFSSHIEASFVVNTVHSISPALYQYLRELILRVRPVM